MGEVFGFVVIFDGMWGGNDYWKLGFYWIVWVIGMLVILGFVDCMIMIIGFGLIFDLIGDVVVDMDWICVFYVDKVGL